MLRKASEPAVALGEVDAALGEAVAPHVVGEEPVGEAVVVERERRVEIGLGTRAHLDALGPLVGRAVLLLGEPEHGLGRAARMEALVLEQDPPRDVARSDRADDRVASVLDRDRDRGVQELAPEPLPR